MKILYMSERFAPFLGGIETMSEHLLHALIQQGHRVQVVTSHCDADLPDQEEWNGVPVHRLHFLTSLAKRDVRGILEARNGLRAIKQEFAPDIAHLQFSGPSPIFHWDTQDVGAIPTIVSVHSVTEKVAPNRSIYFDTVNRADWIAPVSRHMLDWTLGHAPQIADKASVVYNGIPEEQIAKTISPFDFENPVILWIGRMIGWKRVDRLIDAFSLLGRKHPALRLLLVGDGPERKALERHVVAADLADRVTFTGWVDSAERSRLLRASTIVAIPSETEENLPMVALEAAGAGRPIVGSAVSGLPEVVEHDRSGLLIEDVNPASLANAISGMLAEPQTMQAMARRGSDIVRERFSRDAMTANYLGLYHSIAGPGCG